jgi:CheY-like chemotaxis protein
VLVVDDTPDVPQVVADMLTEGGAKVTAVGSPEEALAALQSERPDVLLSDLAQPGEGGYWLIQQVRALPPERGGITPAAALAGLTGLEHRERLLRARFQLYYVEKPVGLETLIGAVALLAQRGTAVALGHSDVERIEGHVGHRTEPEAR